MKAIKTITIGELRVRLLNQLNALNDNDIVTFGGGRLSLNQLQNIGPKNGMQMFDIDFSEAYEVTMDPAET
jgi:hypothetical protein